jgi:2-oxoglutarate ferredoxin oxidoreductase subunit beta
VQAEPQPGELIELPQADGSMMRLRRLHAGYDPTSRLGAMNHVQAMHAEGEIATGLLYVEAEASDLHAALNTSARPLNALGEAELCPGAERLAKINDSLR